MLLFAVTGCGAASPDILCSFNSPPEHSDLTQSEAGLLDDSLTQLHMCSLPDSPLIREKVINPKVNVFSANSNNMCS